MTAWPPCEPAEASAYPKFRDGREACADLDVDPEIFYVDLQVGAEPGKGVCRACPLRDECLEWALATDQRFGIWGATTPDERRKIAEKRRQP